MRNFRNFILFSVLLISNISLAQEDDKKIPEFGIVKYVRGKANLVTSTGQQKKLKKGTSFRSGDTIKTSAKSFAILKFPEGSTIKMDPATELKIEKIMKPKNNGFINYSSVIMKSGGAMVDVIKVFSGPPSLEIKTKTNTSLGVRGTAFYAFTDQKSQNIWLVVKEGKMHVVDYAKDDSEWVGKGNSLALLKGTQLTKPYRYQWVKGLRWNKNPAKGSLETMANLTGPFRRDELSRLLGQVRSRQRKRARASLTKLINEIKDKVRFPVKTYKIDDNYNHLETDKVKASKKTTKKTNSNVFDISMGEKAKPEASGLCNDIKGSSGFKCTVRTTSCGPNEMLAALYRDEVNNKSYSVCVAWVSGSQLKL